MFNLEQSITEWRKQMLVAGIKKPALLEELDGHLREEIERQMKSGMSTQIAFATAVESIGRGDSLKREFEQAGRVDKLNQRKYVGYFFSMTIAFYLVASACVMWKNSLSTVEWWLGMAAQATLVLLLWLSWRWVPVLFPAITSRRVHSAVGLIGSISGMLWFIAFAYLILPHYDFTSGQLTVAIFWAIVPMLVLPSIAFHVLDKGEEQFMRRDPEK